jgi:hypothetical protein
MNRDIYEKAKKQLAQVSRVLREENLTPEERENFETLQTQLSGLLLSPWLPYGWGRRSIMLALFAVGAVGALGVNTYFFLAWVFLLFFSPRVVGEVSYALGKIFRGLS